MKTQTASLPVAPNPPTVSIEHLILSVRGERVMLASDLAATPAVTAHLLIGSSRPSGDFQITVASQPGQSNAVEVSTNLVDWSPLRILVSTNATVQFFDSAATNFSRRFDRAVAP